MMAELWGDKPDPWPESWWVTFINAIDVWMMDNPGLVLFLIMSFMPLIVIILICFTGKG